MQSLDLGQCKLEIPATWQQVDTQPSRWDAGSGTWLYHPDRCLPNLRFRFWEEADTTLNRDLTCPLSVFYNGRDTLYLDTCSMAVWLNHCGMPEWVCAYRVSDRVKAHYYEQNADFTDSPKTPIPDIDPIPAWSYVRLQERLFILAFDGLRSRIPSGFFYDGSMDNRPLNLYGFNLDEKTKAEIRKVLETVRFEE